MSEYKRPLSELEFDKNFAQKKPLMNSTEAYYESSRCLFCYDAPCMNACPTHIDIPLFIKQIHTGNVEGAAKTIYDSNWMGNACAKVCPTGVLCEGACVYTNQNVKPIDIGRLQNYATLAAIKQEKKLFTPGKDNGKKIAIIGAGPAGLSAACELRTMGYAVDVFEAKAKPTGLTVYGVAPYKINNDEALQEEVYLQKQLGYNVIYNKAITAVEQLKEIESKYDAVFLGVGLGPTASLGIPGEEAANVIGAVEFIEELRMKHHTVKVPAKVVVIGGGNTAMDAASESARMGADEVTLAYRRDKKGMGAYKFEYDLALSAGVKGLFNASPLEITANGVKFIKTQEVNGKLENIADSEFTIECDLVIKATGQAKMGTLLKQINGLQLDKSNRIVVNTESFQTGNLKYFAGGDAVNGGAEVVNGAYEGKMAALGIDKWLKSVNG